MVLIPTEKKREGGRREEGGGKGRRKEGRGGGRREEGGGRMERERIIHCYMCLRLAVGATIHSW